MRNLILTVVNLAAYAVAAMALFVLSPVADLSLPWWVALAAPAVVYTLLVMMCCPRATTAEAIGIVALLFVAHAALASATGMVYAAFTALPYPAAIAVAAWEYLPAPMLQLLCVSLLVLPFRSLYAPPRARRRRSLAATGVNADSLPLRSAADLPPSPFVAPDLPEMPGANPAAPVPNGGAGGPVSHSAGIPPIAGGSRRDGAERVEEVVSIPFHRIAAQLPAGAFTIPPDRLGANLLEPGHLLVPTHVVVPQLADGHVTVAWEEVADQFPRHALAVNEATVRDGLPEGRIVLPLDEVVRRLPPELFASSLPGADVQALERFPLPFRPVQPDPVMPAAIPVPPPTPAPAVPEAVVEAAPPVMEAAPSIVEATPPPVPEVAELEPPRTLSVEAARRPEAPPRTASAPVEYIPPFLIADREIEYGLGTPTMEPATIDEPAPVRTPAVDTAPAEASPTPVPAFSPPPLPAAPVKAPLLERVRREAPPVHAPRSEMPPAEPVASPEPVSPPVTSDRGRQAGQLAAVLTPFGALEVSSTGIEGVTLFTFASGALPAEAVLRTAGSILPFLMAGRAPWSVDQLTVRREGGTIIITPLGSVESGGPAMVASIGRVGSLALLEIVCLKAAREHRLTFPGTAARREPAAPAAPPTQYETRSAGGLSLGFLAGDLDAFGRVAPTVLRDSAGGNEVCVFLAPGEDSRAVAGFSVDLCRALVESDEPTLGPLQSVTFRLGERRLVVRPVKGVPGRFSVLVAAGEAVDRPGLAHRQLERAAALLRGV